MNNQARGKDGEEKAAAFLIKKGYEIIEKNYRNRRGEIDIIAKKDKILVFVEVKMRNGTLFGNPEESVDYRKASMVVATADNYIYEKDWHGDIRFDIVAVATVGEKVVQFEDAFH